MTSKKEQVWSTTENKYVEVEIEGSREPYVSKLEDAAAKWADEHSSIGHEQGEREAFELGARWLLEEAKKKWGQTSVDLDNMKEFHDRKVRIADLVELVGDK